MNNKAVAVFGAVAVLGLVVVVWLMPSSQPSATETAARLVRGEDAEHGVTDVSSGAADKPTRSAGSGSSGSTRLSTGGDSDSAEASDPAADDEPAIDSKKRSHRPRSNRKPARADSGREAVEEESGKTSSGIHLGSKRVRRSGG